MKQKYYTKVVVSQADTYEEETTFLSIFTFLFIFL
jgi:hypothetical protein